MVQPEVPGIDPARMHALTADPRRYGFHATLKPPFELSMESTEADLLAAFRSFALGRSAFDLPLAVARLDGFLALVPPRPEIASRSLADDCVVAFEPFRAPPAKAELEKRRQTGLTAAQDDNLVRWGYPYVFDDFRFHLTLSQRLDGNEADRLHSAATLYFADPLAGPVAIETLALFVERSPGAPFSVLATAKLGRERPTGVE
jgi:hypothetical protein